MLERLSFGIMKYLMKDTIKYIFNYNTIDFQTRERMQVSRNV